MFLAPYFIIFQPCNKNLLETVHPCRYSLLNEIVFERWTTRPPSSLSWQSWPRHRRQKMWNIMKPSAVWTEHLRTLMYCKIIAKSCKIIYFIFLKKRQQLFFGLNKNWWKATEDDCKQLPCSPLPRRTWHSCARKRRNCRLTQHPQVSRACWHLECWELWLIKNTSNWEIFRALAYRWPFHKSRWDNSS